MCVCVCVGVCVCVCVGEVGVVGKRGALIEGEEGGKEAWAV